MSAALLSEVCCSSQIRPSQKAVQPRSISKSFTGSVVVLRQQKACNLRSARCAASIRAEEATQVVDAPTAGSNGVPIELTGPDLKPVKEIQEIMEILPHRYPFLLVDRVVAWEHQKFAVGYKNITINDNFFPGHFPQRAIMPGVLQVEALAQLGGIVMIDPANKATQENFFFGGVEKCKWRKPVVPGDTLMMKVEVTKYNKRFGIVKMDAKAYVGSSLVCEAELTLAMGK